MGTRADLHELLTELLGTANVYFSPPPELKMSYPCIVYNRDRPRVIFGGNAMYGLRKGYMLTVIDRDPDSEIPDRVSALPYCSFERFFATNNLNHTIYKIFF
jgi:hypothetical protein